MERTKPNANFQPQIVQYRPAERSMLRNVPPFVRPSSKNFAFVRTNSSTNLNFASNALTAPTPAAPFPHGDPCFVAAGRLRAAEWTRRWQDGQASRAGAIWVPHWGQASGWRPAAPTSASVIDYATPSRDARRPG